MLRKIIKILIFSVILSVYAFSHTEYFYNQLNDNEKKVYNQLREKISKLDDLTNLENMEIETDSPNGKIIFAFFRDHPEYFYIADYNLVWEEISTNKYKLGAKVKTEGYIVNGIKKEEIPKLKERFDSKVNEIVSKAPQDTEQKIKYFLDWLALNNTYNPSGLGATNFSRVAVSGILSNNSLDNGPVCYGYATALKVLLDKANIENVYVEGFAYNQKNMPNGEQHAWNYVNLDGAWYAIDPTWDDPSITSQSARLVYFLVGSETETEKAVTGKTKFSQNHLVDNYSPAIKNHNFTYPTLSATAKKQISNKIEVITENSTKQVDDIKEALSSINSETIVKLWNNLEISEDITLPNNVIIDLNGQDRNTSTPTIKMVNNKLIIQSGSKVKIINNGSGQATISVNLIENNGVLELGPNVTIKGSGIKAISGNEAIASDYAYVPNGNSKNINSYQVVPPIAIKDLDYNIKENDTLNTLLEMVKTTYPKIKDLKFITGQNTPPIPETKIPESNWQVYSYNGDRNVLDLTKKLEKGEVIFVTKVFGYDVTYKINLKSENLYLSDDEIKALGNELKILMEELKNTIDKYNGIYSETAKENIAEKLNLYMKKREELIVELDKLPSENILKNLINDFPEYKNVEINDIDSNGKIDVKELEESKLKINELNELEKEIDDLENKYKDSTINEDNKKIIDDKKSEYNQKLKEYKIIINKLSDNISGVNDLKNEINSLKEKDLNTILVNDIDKNNIIDSKEVENAQNKIRELEELEKNIKNLENSLTDIVNSIQKENIDNEKKLYNEKLEKYKKDINSISDLIVDIKTIKQNINSKTLLDLSTVVVNDIDNNGKKDVDEVNSIKEILKSIKLLEDKIIELKKGDYTLTNTEKIEINKKIDEYELEKSKLKSLIDILSDKIEEKPKLLEEFSKYQEFKKYSIDSQTENEYREKLNDKVKELEEILKYDESNKEKINQKIDEINNKEIVDSEELKKYITNLDVFIKDEYINVLNKLKEDIFSIKQTQNYIKSNENSKNNLDNLLLNNHINFTKDELKKYYVDLKEAINNLDGDLRESTKYVYAFQYDDISIKDRFNENYYFKFKLGSTISNILFNIITNDKIYSKYLVSNVQLGFNTEINKNIDLKLGAFIEYSNNVANQVSIGFNVKNKYFTAFTRYRLAILNKEILQNKEVILNNNIDFYVSANYLYKLNNLEINPRLGIYLVTSLNTKLENDVYLKTRVYGNLEFANNISYILNDYKLYNDLSFKVGYNNPILEKNGKQMEVNNKFYLTYNILFGFDKKVYDNLSVGANIELNGRYDKLYGKSNKDVNVKLGANVSYLFR